MKEVFSEYDKNLFQKYNVIPLEQLSEKPGRRVYLVATENHQKLILKINQQSPGKLKREYLFLKSASDIPLQWLKIPQPLKYENCVLLMEFMSRQTLTRDSVLEKNWDERMVHIWVQGLIEFQQLPLSRRSFKTIEILKGRIFPLYRMMQLLKWGINNLGIIAYIKCMVLIFYYLIRKTESNNVTTHYDLQTFNYTPLNDDSKMSMIDFEIGAYKGDSLYDILYYLSIPVVALDKWNFQRNIFQNWIDNFETEKRSQPIRTRVLLILITIQRMVRFKNDKALQDVYRKNFEILMSNSHFKKWFHKINLKPSKQNI